ncbi:serine--tRNA ligase, partial [Tanacetum coccineum]
MLVLTGRQVETELKLQEKFRELCEEVSTVVKEKEEVVEELEREEKGYNPEIICESQRRRFKPVEIVDEIILLDKEWRQRQFELEQLRKDFNKLNKEVAKLRI